MVEYATLVRKSDLDARPKGREECTGFISDSLGADQIVYQYAARLHNEPGPGLSHLWLALSLVIWSVSRNSRFSTLDSAWVQSGLAIVPVSMTPSAS